jgi:DNA-binding winged helix-turn-helix (wHTH) protein/tetratricopeptide (TPR) repeat protein
MDVGRLPTAHPLIRFGSFEVDLGASELRKDGIKVKLQDLPFRLLVCLLEHPGEVVTREQLQAKLWPAGTFVDFERGLRVALNKLREALCDSAVEPRFIETIPRRGYRFRTEVEKSEAPGLEPAPVLNREKRRVALVAAAVIALIAVALVLGLRTPPKPLTNRDVLVLADFTNSTGDPVFDGTLREALAYQLEQSPFLKILDDDVMRQDLILMRRSPGEHITNALAHDICVREAQTAMLGGSIVGIGKSYAIELKVTNCQTGSTLGREQGEASDKEHLLQALAKAAQGMRAKLGESLSSIHRLAPPVFRFTTGSLEAFRAFSEGLVLFDEGRFVEAVPLLRRATELDPNLAFAWPWLTSATLNTGAGGDPALQKEYENRGWELRNQVSEYERLYLTAYHYQATGQSDKAVEAYELWKRTYPRDAVPFSQVGLILGNEGQFEDAARNHLEAVRLAPRRANTGAVLMQDFIRLDRFDDAKAEAQNLFSQGFDNPQVHRYLLKIAWIEGDSAAAAAQIQWFTGKPEEHIGLEDQSGHLRMLGHLRQSRELLEEAAGLARRRNLPDVAARFLRPDPDGDALLGNCSTAQATRSSSTTTLALCGDVAMVERAERIAMETSKSQPDDTRRNGARLPMIRAAEELSRARPDKAIEVLSSMQFERAYPLATYLRGMAYLRMKRGTEAVAEFQKIIDHKGANWGPLYPLSFVGLARGAVLTRHKTQARRAYEEFFRQWKDADRDVPVLMQARKEYAALAW